MEERARAIAAELRCPVCQNLSVADSPSEMAQQMRALVKEQIKEGKSPEEIKNFFVSKYGDWVLLAPPARGFSLLIWVLPGVVAVAGLALVLLLMRRWVQRKPAPETLFEHGEARRELLSREQTRLEAEIRELEFDFQAGKLSEADYGDLRRDLQTQEGAVQKRLQAMPTERPRSAAEPVPEKKKAPAMETHPTRRWPLVAGGVFLLLFGLALGVLLTQSIRPRGSTQDSITGDFLTGTQSAGGADALLAQGRAAFEQRNWPQAIELFKRVLAADPNQPEAHAYMGLILAQAGHAEGALMAFDRALSVAPNFPPALWGKGMVLSQTGGDPAEARRLLQKVSAMMPPGPEKDEVEKTIARLGKGGAQASPVAGTQIQGTVDVDSKVKDKAGGQAVLFIIARSTGAAAGPPLAVKRIAAPRFPVAYSLSGEDVMMPGAKLAGKVFISARLDQDGNPSTKEPGNLAGEYKKNPVEVGAKNIDIVLEQVK